MKGRPARELSEEDIKAIYTSEDGITKLATRYEVADDRITAIKNAATLEEAGKFARGLPKKDSAKEEAERQAEEQERLRAEAERKSQPQGKNQNTGQERINELERLLSDRDQELSMASSRLAELEEKPTGDGHSPDGLDTIQINEEGLKLSITVPPVVLTLFDFAKAAKLVKEDVDLDGWLFQCVQKRFELDYKLQLALVPIIEEE